MKNFEFRISDVFRISSLWNLFRITLFSLPERLWRWDISMSRDDSDYVDVNGEV